MTDKERLEQIKNKKFFDVGYGDLLNLEDVNWLIEQAERVHELEEIIEDYKTVNKESYDRRKKLRKQNKRYREAIKETKNIIEEAIVSLDNNEKVQGLEWAVKRVDEALEDEE